MPKRRRPDRKSAKCTLPRVIKALIATEGSFVRSAELCGMTRQALRDRVLRTPKLQEVMRQINAAVDVSDEMTTLQARDIVKTAITAGDLSTGKWWLEKRDPAFRPSAALKLDEDTIRAMMAAASPEDLRKLAAG